MAKDYSSVELPHETKTVSGTGVVILAVVSDKCVGYYYYPDSSGAVMNAHAADWSLEGRFSLHASSTQLDLIPPPGAVEDRLNALGIERQQLMERLENYPAAPADWRKADVQRVERIDLEIATLTQLGGKDADS